MPVLHGLGFVTQFEFEAHATHVPTREQTIPAPQLVPGAWKVLSTQVIAPVAQEVMPDQQTLGFVVQAAPAVHATQMPAPLQTMSGPQVTPAGLLAPSVQVVVPPLQVVTPCLHTLGLPVQLTLAMQGPQKPAPSHIRPVPQTVVDGLGVPSTQVMMRPDAQDVTPFRHIDGLVVHACPAVHATQVPDPLQTRLVPQVVPAAVSPPSRHCAVPVLQSTTPVLQGAPGFVAQACPLAHPTHCPLPLQTMPEPQAVPAAAFAPSTQSGDVRHAMMPILQAPPGLLVQTVPAAQLAHAPLLQILSSPHDVPSGAGMSSRHRGAPVLQSVAPSWQGAAGLVAQRAPCVHWMQVPPRLQTCPVPQVAPADLSVPFVQPVGLQVVTPFAQGSLFVAHAIPAVHAVHAPLTQILSAAQSVPSTAFGPSTQVLASAPHAIRPTLHGAPGLLVHDSVGHAPAAPPAPPPAEPPAPPLAPAAPPPPWPVAMGGASPMHPLAPAIHAVANSRPQTDFHLCVHLVIERPPARIRPGSGRPGERRGRRRPSAP
jgi:hypothetical protein